MNRYENTRTSSIMRWVLEEIPLNQSEINISRLARDLEVSHTNIWFYLKGLRKWNIEIWLDMLAIMGRVRVNDDGIQLDIPINQEMQDHLETLDTLSSDYLLEDGSGRKEEPDPSKL